MGRLLATAGSRLRLNSHPGTLFLTLTKMTIKAIIGRNDARIETIEKSAWVDQGK